MGVFIMGVSGELAPPPIPPLTISSNEYKWRWYICI